MPHNFISGTRTPFIRQQTAIFKKKENEAFNLVFRAVEEMQERISVAKFPQRQKVPMSGAFYGLVAGRFHPAVVIKAYSHRNRERLKPASFL